jgi:hypothetical protein
MPSSTAVAPNDLRSPVASIAPERAGTVVMPFPFVTVIPISAQDAQSRIDQRFQPPRRNRHLVAAPVGLTGREN